MPVKQTGYQFSTFRPTVGRCRMFSPFYGHPHRQTRVRGAEATLVDRAPGHVGRRERRSM
jgi:hypothetical protein